MPLSDASRLAWRHDCLRSATAAFDIMRMLTGRDAVTTIEELLALPDDGLRHELLDGAHVVTPAPDYPHQDLLSELEFLLRRAVGVSATLKVLWGPADIVLGPKTLVQPDLFVVRKKPGEPPHRWAQVGVPILAVEVVSPVTAARDRGVKRRLYQQAGVMEYWIVDLDARLVERWRPEDTRPEVLSEMLAWQPEVGTAATIDLPQLFRSVLGVA